MKKKFNQKGFIYFVWTLLSSHIDKSRGTVPLFKEEQRWYLVGHIDKTQDRKK
jgi:hypothetical protein